MKPTMRLSVASCCPVDGIVFVGVDDQRAVGVLPRLGEIRGGAPARLPQRESAARQAPRAENVAGAIELQALILRVRRYRMVDELPSPGAAHGSNGFGDPGRSTDAPSNGRMCEPMPRAAVGRPATSPCGPTFVRRLSPASLTQTRANIRVTKFDVYVKSMVAQWLVALPLVCGARLARHEAGGRRHVSRTRRGNRLHAEACGGLKAALDAGAFGDLERGPGRRDPCARPAASPPRRWRRCDKIGDEQGAVLKDAAVTTPPGWKELYRRWIEGGWNALSGAGGIRRPGPADDARRRRARNVELRPPWPSASARR